MSGNDSPSPVNYAALSPVSFLRRARDIFPDRLAVIYKERHYTWRQVYHRCLSLASALAVHGIQRGDVVSVMLPNTPEMVEAHFALPMHGAVLNTINTRLDPETVGYILEHGEAQCVIFDQQFAPIIKEAVSHLARPPLLIEVIDMHSAHNIPTPVLGVQSYEDFLKTAQTDYQWSLPRSEWETIALNYTSGTSGKPKGVLYHHRGAYLMAMGTASTWEMGKHPRYLYSVPMFHCNGWGHCWMLAMLAGTIYCLRQVTSAEIYAAVAQHRITHFGGAPIVLSMLINAQQEERRDFSHVVQVMTAGAPPPQAVLQKVQELGFNVMQVYGLTETYGHILHCLWQDDWDGLSMTEQAEIKARQGVRFPMCEKIVVIDLKTGVPVPADGETAGEITLHGNTIMKGYHRDPEATAQAFAGDVFHSGDIAVVHPDGYIEVKDRLKDVIISGGENISSVEVEAVLYKHPATVHAAVVAKPDEKWGEVPCAFIETNDDPPSAEEIIAFCRKHLAGFKIPKHVYFTELPKTATGKIQKFALRERAKHL